MIDEIGCTRAQMIHRRKRLMQAMDGQSVALIPAAPEYIRNRDSHFPYRPDSDFWYLTGFPEPSALLLIAPEHPKTQVILFCQERDIAKEQWSGRRIGVEDAAEKYGVDVAYCITQIDDVLPKLLSGCKKIYYPMGRYAQFDQNVLTWTMHTRASPSAVSPSIFEDVGVLINPLRLIKTPEEIALMQHAATISVEAHRAAMQHAAVGMKEYALQAHIEYVFKKHGACPAYNTIVGSGENACILHYQTNRATCSNGDLVLIDAGAEYLGYAADITRTFPVNGTFTPDQKALYNVVVKAYEAALAVAIPGKTFEECHLAAVHEITEGLLQLGLLQGSFENAVQQKLYSRFYPHRTGHWLGIDVHDVGQYVDAQRASRVLEAGMVFTIEPGIYIPPDHQQVPSRWRGMGVRLEDDIHITPEGHSVLTGALDYRAEAIEALMAGRSGV